MKGELGLQLGKTHAKQRSTKEGDVPDEKEIKYRDESGNEVSETVDAETLDEKMNEAEAVYGGEGDEKRRAAYLAEEPGDTPDEPVTGERES